MGSYTVIDSPTAPGYKVVEPPLSMAEEAIGIAKNLARQTGLAARYLIEGPGSLVELFGLGLGKAIYHALPIVAPELRDIVPNPQPGALSRLADTVGLPSPNTPGERLVGDVSRGLGAAMTGLGVGGVLAKEAAPVVSSIGRAMQAAPALQAAGGAGGGTGAGIAREAGLGPAAQLFLGLAGGIGAPTAMNLAQELLPAGYRLASSVGNAFTKEGQQGMAGRALLNSASDPAAVRSALGVPDVPLSPEATALRARLGYPAPQTPSPAAIPQYVPGSQPTTAQALADPGLLRRERTLSPTVTDFGEREMANNAARIAELQRIGKSPADLEAAIKDRAANANSDYSFAYDNPIEASSATNRALKPLLETPSMKQAWSMAERTAADMRMPPRKMNTENPYFMHLVKLALDTLSSGPTANAAERYAQSAVGGQGGVRAAFLDALDQISPYYGVARGNYAEASKPIEQMDTLQNLLTSGKPGVLGTTTDTMGNRNILPSAWTRYVTDNPDLAEVLTPNQMGTLGNIGKDITRSNLTQTTLRPTGSNTGENLLNIGSNTAMTSAVGPGMAATPAANLLNFPVKKLFDIAGINTSVREYLVRAMMDPGVASAYVAAANAGKNPTLGELFMAGQSAGTQGALAGTGATLAGGSP